MKTAIVKKHEIEFFKVKFQAVCFLTNEILLILTLLLGIIANFYTI